MAATRKLRIVSNVTRFTALTSALTDLSISYEVVDYYQKRRLLLIRATVLKSEFNTIYGACLVAAAQADEGGYGGGR
jgi:hypothetical protein